MTLSLAARELYSVADRGAEHSTQSACVTEDIQSQLFAKACRTAAGSGVGRMSQSSMTYDGSGEAEGTAG